MKYSGSSERNLCMFCWACILRLRGVLYSVVPKSCVLSFVVLVFGQAFSAEPSHGVFLIRAGTYLYDKPTMKGSSIFVKKGGMYSVLAVAQKNDSGELLLLLESAGSGASTEKIGYVYEVPGEVDTDGAILKKTLKVYDSIPGTQTAFPQWHSLPSPLLEFTGKEQVSSTYTNLTWYQVRYQKRPKIRRWAYYSSGLYRADRDLDWLAKTLAAAKDKQISGKPLTRLILGQPQIGYTEDFLLLSLGDPVAVVEELQRTSLWKYRYRIYAIRNGVITDIQ